MAFKHGSATKTRHKCNKARKKRASLPKALQPRFPYFAHQQLDLKEFPPAIGILVDEPRKAPAHNATLKSNKDVWKEEGLEDDLEALSNGFDLKDESSHKPSPPSAQRNPYKQLKTPGGRPAMPKKVTADLDVEDQIIKRMKEAKYLERDIVERLVAEGRIRYHVKTIGTRYSRIKKKLEERNDALLDAELTDWHDGDDDALERAIQQANVTIEKAIAEIEARRWRIVADNLKSIKPVTSFSQHACRSRYKALQNGTAKATPESILNPCDNIKARIAARKDKEAAIERDKVAFREGVQADSQTLVLAVANLRGNAWTSRKKS